MDLLLPLMHHDLSYFGSLILIQIALKEGTLSVEEIISLNRVHDYNHDMFALRNPLKYNYRSFETLVM